MYMQNVLTKLYVEAMANYVIGSYEERELDYVDLFYPKVAFFLGSNNIERIIKGEEVLPILQSVGLSIDDYQKILEIIATGWVAYEDNPDLEYLRDINERSNEMLLPMIQKVMERMISKGTSRETIEGDVNNFFGNDPLIFTPVESLNNLKKM